MPEIAITGATGAIGSTAAHRLADAGLTARLVVRDPDRAPKLTGFDLAVAEHGDVRATVRALEGIDTVFMVSAPDGPGRRELHEDFVDAARQASVRHVVYLSYVGAAEDSVNAFARDHGATEQYLADSGLDVTILRPSFHAETLRHFLQDDGIRGPAGDGRIAAVARADVGAAVAAVLADPSAHVGSVYELTGPEALDLHDVANLLGRIDGTPYTYVPETDEEARTGRLAYRAPADLLDAWLSVYVAIRHGVYGHVTGDVQHLLGRPPTPAARALSPGQE